LEDAAHLREASHGFRVPIGVESSHPAQPLVGVGGQSRTEVGHRRACHKIRSLLEPFSPGAEDERSHKA
jgi:hypothetical protein